MFQMAAEGRANSLINFIRKTGNSDLLHQSNEQGLQVIHVSALNGQVQCIRELIETLQANVNALCEKGNQPIHYACISGSLPCMITLMHYGADLRATNPLGQTPLDLIPHPKQAMVGGLLRKAEKKRKELDERRESLVTSLSNLPAPSHNEMAIKGIHPVPFITSNLTKNLKQVETGQDDSAKVFSKGMFDTRRVCVKHIPDPEVYEQTKHSLLDEATLLAEIRHPNILLLLGITSPPDIRYQLVFEEIHVFLHRLVLTEKFELNSEQLLHVGRDVCSALTYLHHRGYIHCSLSCSSLALTSYLTVKLCNFDHAQKLAHATSISHLETAHSHMAPNQLKGMKADASNDVYALGIVMFECATNVSIRTVRPLLLNFKEKEVASFLLKMIPKSLEKSISTLVSSCLAKAKRRASALQVFHWIDALLGCGLAETTPFAMDPEVDYLKLQQLVNED